MEPQASLVGADRAIELYAEAVIYLYLPLVIHPGNAEHNYSLRRYQSLQQRILSIYIFVCLDHYAQRFQHFLDRLVEFRLSRVLSHYQIKNLINV